MTQIQKGKNMLNRVILMGRITQDLEVKQTQNGVPVLSFSVAVQRSFAKQGEEKQTDFINCVAWRQNAEFISKYFGKGRLICIEGNLRTRTYDDKTGVKHYITEVFVDSVNFTGEPKAQESQNHSNNYQQSAPANNSNNDTAPSNDALSIGNLADFEEVLNDDEEPF